jgi:hypothetical protein
LNWESSSCCLRFASVSGLSLGWILLLAAAAAAASLGLSEPRAELRFFSLFSPWLERQVRVLERKLDWKLEDDCCAAEDFWLLFEEEEEEECGMVIAIGAGRAAAVGDGRVSGVETPEE